MYLLLFEIYFSLGPFCWRVLSYCTIMELEQRGPSPRGQCGKWYEKYSFHLIFTFYLNRHIGDRIFPCRILMRKKDDSPWDPCWTIYLQTKLSLNCWIAAGRTKITIISIHITANQNSNHNDKSTLYCLICIFCPQQIRTRNCRSVIY